ncbi:hypothetical protein C0Q70_13702 [Pomacea canaliculata]|uniref:Ribokinase n=2 Tax=Pomacea canaliculata TaxID=400727 RepID=A0A2T7NXZ8_POMCA|nr:ribokinase-like isoform X2 [Pomacea canaliculata]PVD26034.1 hypothetical protein C0Q70_13702 [Pomacea canaliculata]
MAAKLGARTAMVAKLGNDFYGNNTKENFKQHEVDDTHVKQTDRDSSGVASIIVSEDGQNSIVIVSGANLLLSEDDVHAAKDLIRHSKVLVCQLEVPPSTSLAALRLAKSNKVYSIFNPAPAIENLDPQFYTACDMLCANESEAELLTGVPITDEQSAKLAAKKLHEKGCDTVLVTIGDKGSVLHTSGQEGLHIPADSVVAVDTTGAGDAFIGALAFYKATMPTLSLVESVKRASIIAAISCKSRGTQCSFPSADQLNPALLTL